MRPASDVVAVLLLTASVLPASAAGFEVGPTVERRRHRIVFAVGVAEFIDARRSDEASELGWSPLWFAEKDATDIVDHLRPYEFDAFPRTPMLGREATARAVRQRLLEMVRHVESNPRDEFEIVLYFSTHGWSAPLDSGSRSFLILQDSPSEAKLRGALEKDPTGAVEALDREWILASVIDALPENVLRVAVIYDACYVAGGKSRGLRRKSAAPEPTVEDYRLEAEERDRIRRLGRATYVLSAVSLGQAALERREDGNSLYTKFLIEGLVQNARRGEASLFAAHIHATDRVRLLTRGQQIPTYTVPFASEADVAFHLAAPKVSTTGLFLPSPRPVNLVTKVRRLDERTKGASGWTQQTKSPFVSVPGPGRYAVTLADDERAFFERVVDLTDGEVRTLHVWEGLDGPIHGFGIRAGAGRFFDVFGPTSHLAERIDLALRYVQRDRSPTGLEWRVGADAIHGRPLARGTLTDEIDYGLLMVAGDVMTRWALGTTSLGVRAGLALGPMTRRISIGTETQRGVVLAGGPTTAVVTTWPVSSTWDFELSLEGRGLVAGSNAVGLVDVSLGVGVVWHEARWQGE